MSISPVHTDELFTWKPRQMLLRAPPFLRSAVAQNGRWQPPSACLDGHAIGAPPAAVHASVLAPPDQRAQHDLSKLLGAGLLMQYWQAAATVMSSSPGWTTQASPAPVESKPSSCR